MGERQENMRRREGERGGERGERGRELHEKKNERCRGMPQHERVNH